MIWKLLLAERLRFNAGCTEVQISCGSIVCSLRQVAGGIILSYSGLCLCWLWPQLSKDLARISALMTLTHLDPPWPTLTHLDLDLRSVFRMVLGTFISALREGNVKHKQKEVAEARAMAER